MLRIQWRRREQNDRRVADSQLTVQRKKSIPSADASDSFSHAKTNHPPTPKAASAAILTISVSVAPSWTI
jgi:hypothetical protein